MKKIFLSAITSVFACRLVVSNYILTLIFPNWGEYIFPYPTYTQHKIKQLLQ